MVKRVNFNMADECHQLLKSVCALKSMTVSDYVYNIIAAEFKKLVYTDPQVREMFLAGDYPPGSRADLLKRDYLQYRLDHSEDPDNADSDDWAI